MNGETNKIGSQNKTKKPGEASDKSDHVTSDTDKSDALGATSDSSPLSTQHTGRLSESGFDTDGNLRFKKKK
jgi:hypothetical protein